MYLLLSISFFLLLLNTKCLICPVYNLFNNETDTCDKNASLCTYVQSQSNHRRCLGLYTFDPDFTREKENVIRIRQLALFDDYEGKYSNITECNLDIDRTGSHLLCRCNSDNCTFKWRTDESFTQNFSRKINQKYNNYFFPLLITFFILVDLIILILILNYCWYGKDTRLLLANLSSVSTNISNAEIDEFLSSNPTYQSIISHGKSSTIYRAWTTNKGKCPLEKIPVAVKLYYREEYKNLFENEVQILRTIQHSTIINLISYGWHGLSPYIILEYYDLGSLQSYLRSNKLSWETCYSFLVSLIDAIDYLHHEELSLDDYLTSNRICKPILIHRDIKSSNILLKSTPNLSLCLSDFGLAKILPPILTPSDFIQIGTYRYMAPELLELAITHTSDALCKVDIYALGLVMWEVITQCQEYSPSIDYQLPYEEYIHMYESNENQILDTLHRVVVHERKRPIIHRSPNLHSKISDVLTMIEDCWKHEPESRLNARPALYRLRRLA